MKFLGRFVIFLSICLICIFISGALSTCIKWMEYYMDSDIIKQTDFSFKNKCEINISLDYGNIPLNRHIPDSRPERCKTDSLLNATVSIIVVLTNGHSVDLLRTIFSIVNRTPHELLTEIIIIIDGHSSGFVKKVLERCVKNLFPMEIIKVKRMEKIRGVIKAREKGLDKAVGEIVVFLDSGMEVNKHWLEPLIEEIKQNRHTVAQSILDEIEKDTHEYTWNDNVLPIYGFDWTLSVHPLIRQASVDVSLPFLGVVMNGLMFAVSRNFFQEIGGFDVGFDPGGTAAVLELSWRIWLCGGKILHIPCSRIGKLQNDNTVTPNNQTAALLNIKKATDIWMEPNMKEFVYNYYVSLKNTSNKWINDKSDIKSRNGCQSFSWYLKHIYPELLVYNNNVYAWGSVQNILTSLCLDNHGHMLEEEEDLHADVCHYNLISQGFSLTKQGLLRTTLNCVVFINTTIGSRPQLQACNKSGLHQWIHHERGYIKHASTNLCLDLDYWGPVMNLCQSDQLTQKWMFTKYE